jgi:hypothetical protein
MSYLVREFEERTKEMYTSGVKVEIIPLKESLKEYSTYQLIKMCGIKIIYDISDDEFIGDDLDLGWFNE